MFAKLYTEDIVNVLLSKEYFAECSEEARIFKHFLTLATLKFASSPIETLVRLFLKI